MNQAFGLYISYTLHMALQSPVPHLRINSDRLTARLMDLATISPIEGGGSSRLALTTEDGAGRDLVVEWMKELGLEVSVDVVGNVVGTWQVGTGAAVMTGSHIDTVKTGGKYDGNLGVLAGLEVIQSIQESGHIPSRPLSVAFFTNEEGARFAPDMFGSLVYVGGLSVEEALDTVGIDGAKVSDELERIGYNGATPCPGLFPSSFVELHIEQGPVLEIEDFTIGAVTGVQGISWQELTVEGQSNHAGTTPMSMRHDPAFVAASIAVFVRNLASRYGGHQVGTVGKIDLFPNLINVVPAKAVLTVDLRNTDEQLLQKAENELVNFLDELSNSEGVTITSRVLARFEPVNFDPEMISLVESIATEHGNSVRRMPSGAGHDAQMLARVCPASMIFVPSVKGISHNPAEHTSTEDIAAGANVLLQTILALAEKKD